MVYSRRVKSACGVFGCSLRCAMWCFSPVLSMEVWKIGREGCVRTRVRRDLLHAVWRPAAGVVLLPICWTCVGWELVPEGSSEAQAAVVGRNRWDGSRRVGCVGGCWSRAACEEIRELGAGGDWCAVEERGRMLSPRGDEGSSGLSGRREWVGAWRIEQKGVDVGVGGAGNGESEVWRRRGHSEGSEGVG